MNPHEIPSTALEAALRIPKPNKIGLPADEWVPVAVTFRGMALVTTAAAATVTAIPEMPNAQTVSQGEFLTAFKLSATSYLLFFNAKGNWRVRTTSAGSLVLFDDHTGVLALMAAMKGINVIGGSSGLAADVRDADASADFAAALLGLVVNARGGSFDVNADWVRNPASALNRIHTDLSAGLPVPAQIAIAVGENFAASAFGKIKQGSFDSDFNAFDEATAGLQVNARLGGIAVDGEVRRACVVPLSAGTPSGEQNALLQTPLAEARYAALRRGKRFCVGSGRGVAVAGTNGYVATSPSILIIPNTGERVVLDRLLISFQDLTGVTGPIGVFVVIDPDDRYDSGGTARVPVNPGASHTVTFVPERCVDGAIVATAEDGDERDIASIYRTDVVNPDDIEVPFGSGVELYENTTLLVYVTCNGGTAPDFGWTLEGFENS